MTINPSLTLDRPPCFTVMAAYAFYFNRRMNAACASARSGSATSTRQVEDTSGIRMVKSFTNEAVEMRKFDAENRRFLASRRDGRPQRSHLLRRYDRLHPTDHDWCDSSWRRRHHECEAGLADLLTYLPCRHPDELITRLV
ncbi:MAG: hypothetical protein U0703_21380 [Anaerolineae bacterium]